MALKLNPHIYKIIPIGGWLISIAGLFVAIDNIFVYAVWVLIFFACVVLHAAQLFLSIPIGRRAGHGYPEIIFNTLLYGAAWWVPLKQGAQSNADN